VRQYYYDKDKNKFEISPVYANFLRIKKRELKNQLKKVLCSQDKIVTLIGSYFQK